MIIEQSVPVAIIIEMVSIGLIVFSLRHLSIGRHYEGDNDKKIITWFMAGLMLLAVGSVANLVGVFNLHSYFLNNIPFQIFAVLAPLSFLIGIIKLRKS